jgi:cytidylate kinase
LFGYFIDLSMVLLSFVDPQTYAAKIIYLLIGCAILGFGVYMEVLANVVMLPGESFVRAVVFTWKTDFGISKIVFDVSMTVIACILSFVLSGKLQGVREGTIVAALLVGFIARYIGRKLSFLPERIFGPQETDGQTAGATADAAAGASVAAATGVEAKATSAAAAGAAGQRKFCIVIGRQYGSGGHDYGKHLAEKLGISFYDNEIIDMISGIVHYEPGYISKNEESMSNSILYDLVHQAYSYSPESLAPKDAIFEAEIKVIRELARKENCVIVGRCADFILQDDPNCLRLFLHAPLEVRVKTIAAKEGLTEEKARREIQNKDRQRADNYRYYTGQIWGLGRNYHLSLDTTFGVAFMDEMVVQALDRLAGA